MSRSGFGRSCGQRTFEIGGLALSGGCNRQGMPKRTGARSFRKKRGIQVLLVVLTRLSHAGYDPRESVAEGLCERFIRILFAELFAGSVRP